MPVLAIKTTNTLATKNNHLSLCGGVGMNDERLHAPEYDVCYHFRGGHAGVLGEVVGNVQEGWPGWPGFTYILSRFHLLKRRRGPT